VAEALSKTAANIARVDLIVISRIPFNLSGIERRANNAPGIPIMGLFVTLMWRGAVSKWAKPMGFCCIAA